MRKVLTTPFLLQGKALLDLDLQWLIYFLETTVQCRM